MATEVLQSSDGLPFATMLLEDLKLLNNEQLAQEKTERGKVVCVLRA